MPQSQADVILDSITLDNIDDAMYFYSHILEKIVEKKKKFQHNEDILICQLKKLDIKKEIKKLKRSMETDSETSDE
jgi:hypothetical protein